MKRFLPVLLCGLMLAVLAGCAARGGAAPEGDGLSVVSTIFASYDFVRQIAGDKAEVMMLLPPGAESHSYEPTPRDIITIQNCDIFIYVGGESDAWVRGVLESMETPDMTVVKLLDCVEAVAEEIVEGMEDDHDADNHDEGHDDHALDEHVWTSPRNAKVITLRLLEALCGADAPNAELYRENAEGYTAKLDALDAELKAAVEAGTRRTIVFGDRFPFRYLADAYGLTYYAAFPGCSTETEPSAATVAFLMDKIKDEGIPAVFHVELSNQRMAQAIAEETGAEILLLHACHNVTRDEMADGVTYLDLMHQNAENLKEALR